MIGRRSVLAGLVLGSGMSSIGLGASCIVTPSQIEGPFYPVEFGELDADLTRIEGGSTRASGEVIEILGQVTDEKCKPLTGAVVEIWQANSIGRYAHPRDRGVERQLDPNFQGYGRIRLDKQGKYRFITIKPGSYPAMGSWVRPPHIHVRVTAKETSSFTTQMYFAGEQLNEADHLLQRLNLGERTSLIVPFDETREDGVKSGIFNVVLKV